MTCPRSVALVVPNPAGSVTGNEISARRLQTGLLARGLCTEYVRPDEAHADVVARLRAADVELLNAFHAWRTGPRTRRIAADLGRPYVVTITGTDVALHLHDPERAAVMAEVLDGAAAILCGYEGVRERLQRLGAAHVPTFVIPKGVDVPAPSLQPVEAPDGDATGRLLVLQVAHLRPVKNNLLAVRAVRRLAEEGLPVRLVLLGDAIDAGYVRQLEHAAGGAEAWGGIWRPAVAHDRVGEWYAAADVVLNTSDSEGGSNAILEAFAHGIPVVASDVAGNAAYVGVGRERGMLYPAQVAEDGAVSHDEEALVGLLREVLGDATLRGRMGERGRAFVEERHSTAAEVDAILAAYGIVGSARG